jgi:hypothetical protein
VPLVGCVRPRLSCRYAKAYVVRPTTSIVSCPGVKGCSGIGEGGGCTSTAISILGRVNDDNNNIVDEHVEEVNWEAFDSVVTHIVHSNMVSRD